MNAENQQLKNQLAFCFLRSCGTVLGRVRLLESRVQTGPGVEVKLAELMKGAGFKDVRAPSSLETFISFDGTLRSRNCQDRREGRGRH